MKPLPALLTTLLLALALPIAARAEATGERLLAGYRDLAARFPIIGDVRGKGLMIGVEFGAPRSLALKASWSLLESASAGLFCQLITIPLFKTHKILSQVAGHASHTVKLLPPLVISEEDCAWVERAFDAAIADAHRVPGAVWSLGKTLVDNALKARASA